ncbi:MAG: TauD/TfdA family dioxygenase [Candidatus Eremiobacteraeota bacterium]|nr:TauD/TfdA family dioxygenase [Candidatus Eremiobacteraeota bacterium]MBC5824058.1 TauD/TfdA family dioxygenase [Candidatus Eremiobacteraeota bacterium]
MHDLSESAVDRSSPGYPTIVRVPGASAPERFAWIAANKAQLDRTLLRSGAIRLEGLGADTPELFETASGVFFDEAAGYVGGDSPRTRVSSRVYTSTEYPPTQAISLHNEMSFAATWPAQLLFGCIVPAEHGGATPVADSRAILQALDRSIVEEFTARGVCYIRNLPGGNGFGRSWQQTFETDDGAAVERYCRQTGSEFTWKADGGLRLIQRRPAVAVHPLTGETVWFNQADQYHPSTHPPTVYEALVGVYGDDPADLPSNATFGDGGPFPPEMLTTIRQTIAQLTVAFPWERGDALWLDNMLACHGRQPFSGPRRILVSMA